jgi:hypothetical protein
MSILKNNIVVGIAAGLAATILAPVLVPAIKRSSRPLAKFMVKGGITLYESAREAVAGAGEMMEDVVAEVRAESMAHTDEGMHAGMHEEDEGMAGQPVPARGNGASGGMSSVQLERGGAT